MKFALVAIGYNRVNSMSRLLDSLLKADYLGEKVDLIISIDNSGTDTVEKYADKFEWPFGDKIVKTYEKRMGLRNHILTCGDYVYGYDAIAVFEDDIYASPAFYSYMKQAVEFYCDDDNIAGISLYSHFWSEFNKRPFTPHKKKYDNYFLKYAQSWGQVWMPRQWRAFKEWYLCNQEEIKMNEETPAHIAGWPKTSWLKYHIKYCIDQNKYFVYPYLSYSTNFVEIGQHCKTSNTVYQVPMQYEVLDRYDFCRFGDDEGVYYDAYFEREYSFVNLGISTQDITVDLYGNKPISKRRYLLSTKQLDYTIIQSFGLQLRPHEINVLEEIPGEEIFLYDTSISLEKKNIFTRDFDLSRWYYDSRVFDYKYIVRVLSKIFVGKITKRI